MQILGAVDMGSSGARVARVRIEAGTPALASEVSFIDKTVGRRAFRRSVRDAIGEVAGLGVSIAGPTDPTTGSVLFAGAYPWAKGDLAGRLGNKLDLPVTVVNDAEAHLYAHRTLGPAPLICLALGTGMGFAMTDDTGEVSRPRSDTNWELGHLRVLGSIDEDDDRPGDKAVLALGSRGLDELCDVHGTQEGTRRFMTRLGGFVLETSMTFQPRTVVLAGGVTARLGDTLAAHIRNTLERRWPPAVRWDPPTVIASPHGSHSGLLGAAMATVPTASD